MMFYKITFLFSFHLCFSVFDISDLVKNIIKLFVYILLNASFVVCLCHMCRRP